MNQLQSVLQRAAARRTRCNCPNADERDVNDWRRKWMAPPHEEEKMDDGGTGFGFLSLYFF